MADSRVTKDATGMTIRDGNGVIRGYIGLGDIAGTTAGAMLGKTFRPSSREGSTNGAAG